MRPRILTNGPRSTLDRRVGGDEVELTGESIAQACQQFDFVVRRSGVEGRSSVVKVNVKDNHASDPCCPTKDADPGSGA